MFSIEIIRYYDRKPNKAPINKQLPAYYHTTVTKKYLQTINYDFFFANLNNLMSYQAKIPS